MSCCGCGCRGCCCTRAWSRTAGSDRGMAAGSTEVWKAGSSTVAGAGSSDHGRKRAVHKDSSDRVAGCRLRLRMCQLRRLCSIQPECQQP